jgi:hypothetical protein
MAFSRSEERDIQPVSISYSPSAYSPPASTPSYLSPTADEVGVDANAIERWLMSPTKPESTDAHTNKTSDEKNLPRQRLADVTVRRRRQQMQKMHQPSPPRSSQQERQNETPLTAKLFPHASLRQSKLMKQWQHEEQIKLHPSNPVATNINVSKKPEHSRQTVAMKIAAMEKASRGSSHSAIPTLFQTSSSNNTSKDVEKGKDKNKFPFGNDHLPHSRRYDSKDETPALPGVVSVESKEEISECDPSRDIDNKYDDKDNSPIVVTKEEKSNTKKICDQSETIGSIHEHPDVKITRRGTSSPGIAAIRRRRQQRLQQREMEKELQELEKEEQQGQSTETTKTITVISDTQENVNDSAIVHSSLSSQILKIPYNMSTNTVPISPLARNCQIQEADCRNNFIEKKNDDNCDAHDHTNRRIVSVSRTKKIHLLKRHNAGTGGNPLSRPAGLSVGEVRGIDIGATPPLQNNTKQLTIHSNNNCISTMGRLRAIQQQILDGNDSCTREGEHENEDGQRSLPLAVDDPLIASPPLGKYHPSRHQYEEEFVEKLSFQNPRQQQEQQQQEPRMESQTNPQGSLLYYNDHPNIINDDQDECPQNNPYGDQNKYNIASKSNKTTSDKEYCNIQNTRRIKAALARSRSHHHSIIKRNTDLNEIGNDIGRRGSESYNEGILKNHFQSGSISCSSVIATSTSIISVVSADSSCRSNNSRACVDDDGDEVTTIASMSGSISDCDERDGEDVSRLSIPTELNATGVKMTESSLTPSVDKYALAISLDERNQNQKSLYTSHGGNDVEESAIATLEESTIGSSSALTRKTPERLQELKKTSWVKLHVYDLLADDTQLDVWGCHFPLGQVFNAFNSSLHSIGTGAYHVGLEINGVEYAYGANSTRGSTGIFTCMPKSSPGYQFRTTIDFGNRVVMKYSNDAGNKNEEAVDGREIVQKMATEYLGTDYDLLRKNCCTFAYDVCIRLGISEKEIPSWFHNLAAVGAVTQDAANYTLAPITQLFSGNELDKFTEYLNETSLNDKLEAIQDAPSEDKSNREFIADTAYQF